MKLKRRSVLMCVLAVALVGAGCSTSWVTTAEEILAVLTPAITNLVPLVSLADKNVPVNEVSVIQNYSNQANVALQQVGTLIVQYNSASAVEKPGILGKIDASLAVAQNNLNSILPQLHIADPKTQADVQAAVAVAISEVGSISALIPLVKGGNTSRAVVLAKPLSADKFRSRYNAAVKRVPGGNRLTLANPHSFLNSLGSAIGEGIYHRNE